MAVLQSRPGGVPQAAEAPSPTHSPALSSRQRPHMAWNSGQSTRPSQSSSTSQIMSSTSDCRAQAAGRAVHHSFSCDLCRRAPGTPMPAAAPACPHLLGLVPQRLKVAPQLIGANVTVMVGVQQLESSAQLLRLVLAGKPLLRGGARGGERRRRQCQRGAFDSSGAELSPQQSSPSPSPATARSPWRAGRAQSKLGRDVGWRPCVASPCERGSSCELGC